MAASAQQQCYPFLLVCALSLCVCKQRHGCQCATAALPIPIGVCTILVCVQRHGCQCTAAVLTIPIGVCTILVCVQTKAWLPVSGIFNVCTDVDACDCTQVLYGHCKSLHWKLTLGEKSLAAPGTQTGISIVLGFLSQMLYQLSYSLTHFCSLCNARSVRVFVIPSSVMKHCLECYVRIQY